MCGIGGYVSFCQAVQAPQYYKAMEDTMVRRGPDQAGRWGDDHCVLLHRRLAVIDPEGGRQPMELMWQGRLFIMVYNGELYNTEEIRERLMKLHHKFFGHSDTEVLLHAFAQWGEGALELCNGIFSFAVWEPGKKQLFLARDPMGVKPLFYAHCNGGLVFGSEIKTVLAHPEIEKTLDLQSIAEMVIMGPGRTPGCGVYQGIEEVKAGHCGYCDEKGFHPAPYWQPQDAPFTDLPEDAAAHVRHLVIDAIKRQLVSDVPLGTFLSGGLDSSIITAVAAEEYAAKGKRLTTFSVAYRDNEKYFQKSHFQPDSDDEYIDLMVDTFHTDHHRIVLDTPELAEALYDAAMARDLPGMADVDSSLLLFCHEIKKHVTVALSGECADEIFGGYPWYRDRDICMSDGFPWAQSTKYRMTFLRDEIAKELDGDAYVRQRYEETLVRTSKLPNLDPLESRMKEMTRLNLDWFMQTLLDRKDRMSMYHGLEVRVPFCDKRIAQYLYTMPWSIKDYEHREKGILRHAMEGLLPEKVLWRKKSPYPKTHHPAYLAAVSQLMEDVLADANAPIFDIIKPEALRDLLDHDMKYPWYGQLMMKAQVISFFLQLHYVLVSSRH